MLGQFQIGLGLLEVGLGLLKLRDALSELGGRFARSEAFAEERLRDSRNGAIASLALLAALILTGLLWLLFDVNRRILVPTGAAASALEELASDRTPARLFDQSDDEIGELGRHFNRAANLYGERVRALAERDIQASVNAVLAAAASVNDLSGFGSKVLEEVLEISGAACAVLYLPDPDGHFSPAISLGGAEGENLIGREEARRAAHDRRGGQPRRRILSLGGRGNADDQPVRRAHPAA